MNMKLCRWFAGLAVLGALTTQAAALEELSDSEMSQSVAREGIALDLYFGINANPDGSGLARASVPVEDRRLGLQFENRLGEWLVLKDYYGVIEISNLLVDAGITRAAPSGREGNFSQFNDPGGTSLLDPGLGSPAGSVYSLPALQLRLEDAFLIGLTVGNLAIEYDTVPGNDDGYLQDLNAEIIGLKVGRGSEGIAANYQPAEVTINGTVKLFGF